MFQRSTLQTADIDPSRPIMHKTMFNGLTDWRRIMALLYRILNAIFSIILSLMGLGLVVGLLPFLMIKEDFRRLPLEMDVLCIAGLASICLGTVAMLGLIWGWIRAGKGSPILGDLPDELIVRGSYRFVRNPMYVGYFLIVFGEILIFKSFLLVLYLLALFIFFHLLVVFVEEPLLKSAFGESYERYCRSVRRWIPRLTPYRGPSA
jgi:protein-S-isoprenylcysteine O-methyltransferase Ste14